ncbi:hypothetical protein PFLA_a2717 [Pseudoalteromonas flavipulchra NCIMB 2033 = ATCC BAA-314]|nr:hypothetical protein [Pseudoalteromonas flavipulchra NCIMB 2033 = ATCC BAA-314]
MRELLQQQKEPEWMVPITAYFWVDGAKSISFESYLIVNNR